MFPTDLSFWLKGRLDGKRAQVADLLRRLTCLGSREGLSNPRMTRFLQLVDQIADAKTQETQLLDRIDEIEKRHRFDRANNRLHYANASPKSSPAPIQHDQKHAAPEQPKQNLLWLLTLWYAFKPQRQ